jgi:hypothetical protein
MLAIMIKRYFFSKASAGAIWDKSVFIDGARAGAY